MTASPRACLLAAVSSCLLLAACSKGEAPAKAAAAPAAVPVTTMKATLRAVPVSLEAVGQAEGSREVEIRSRVNGILEKRVYEEGAAVKAGEVMFTIDPAPYELAVQQARAALLQERVRKELAETEAQRLEPLAKDRAIPQREVDQALATAKTATAAIAAAEARLKDAELNLSYTRIKAPISGVTGRALRSEGSLITANTDSSLLTTITQVDPVWVRFSIAEPDFRGVRGNERGARVQLLAQDGTVAADDGKLNFSGSSVDARQGAVSMRAEFPNPGRKWMPGQFLKVRVLAGEQQAVLVPQSAVLQNEQSRIVMVVGAENKVEARPIQIGGWFGKDTIVTGGLKEGEAVIVDNLVKVRPGTQVSPSPLGEGRGEGKAR
jgi:membrane fusion protein, multidrug efflux system